MTIRKKIYLCVGAFALMNFIIISLLAFSLKIEQINQEALRIAHDNIRIVHEKKRKVSSLSRTIKERVLLEDKPLVIDLLDRRTDIISGLNELEKTLRENLPDDTSDDLKSFHKLQHSRLRRLFAVAIDQVMEAINLIENGNIEVGRMKLENALFIRFDRDVDNALDRLVNRENLDLLKTNHEIETNASRMVWMVLGLIIINIILVGLAGHTLIYRVSKGIADLGAAATQLTNGKISTRVVPTGSDELTQLAFSFNKMADKLSLERLSLSKMVDERTEELTKANERLRDRDRQRRQFFADIGHELRTPITAIRGEAEIALRAEEFDKDDIRFALEMIVDSSSQMTRLINDIFLIARAQAGVADFHTKHIDIVQVVERTVRQSEGMVEEAGCKIDFQSEMVGFAMSGDSERLTQMVQVLISNSLIHSGKESLISLKLSSTKSHVQLIVEDDGVGVEAEKAEYIFERFETGRRGKKYQSENGTGLGLPIARSIALSHGGDITLDKSYKDGARFIVKLPISNQDSNDNN